MCYDIEKTAVYYHEQNEDFGKRQKYCLSSLIRSLSLFKTEFDNINICEYSID